MGHQVEGRIGAEKVPQWFQNGRPKMPPKWFPNEAREGVPGGVQGGVPGASGGALGRPTGCRGTPGRVRGRFRIDLGVKLGACWVPPWANCEPFL